MDMDLWRLLLLLEERLVQHDDSRKEVQKRLREVCSRMSRDANALEEKLSGEIGSALDEAEDRILSSIETLNSGGGQGAFAEQAQQEPLLEQRYEIQHYGDAENFVDSYKLKISTASIGDGSYFDSFLDAKSGYDESTLKAHLDKIHKAATAAQEELAVICSKRRREAEELGLRINGELELLFTQEDARIQEVVKAAKENTNNKNLADLEEVITRAKSTLFVAQKYGLKEDVLGGNCELIVLKEASIEVIDFEKRAPENILTSYNKKGGLSISFSFFNETEIEPMMELNLPLKVETKIWMKSNSEDTSKMLTKEYTPGGGEPISFGGMLSASTAYCLRTRIAHKGMNSKWSDEAEFVMPEFKECCAWKECPDDINENRKYSVDEENAKIVLMTDWGWRTITGNVSLPPNTVTSWNIKLLRTLRNDGNAIVTGVAPSDINQNDDRNYIKCGWYLHCCDSKLFSGPPHNYNGITYVPRKEYGEYVHTRDSVGILMDTVKGELSFALNGVNLGVAYEGIPLDKPLVPCVILWNEGDSVELDTSEVRENVNSSIPVPSNITTKSTTWDSITLTWDAVEVASFYQIEVDGNKFWASSTTNAFTKRRLLPETEHTFRVRAVRGSSASEWSDAVKGRTQKEPDFSECTWKECPDDVYKEQKYSVYGENPRIATNPNDDECTFVGNIPLPPNKATSWSVKILKSKWNDGGLIYIGVAPSDINQNEEHNHNKCGWYFNCCCSTLLSGPPHNHRGKEYGPRKEDGEYVHTGDSVGVVMDTEKGELSFALNGVDLGVAFEGIPLDKPLVPCVLLHFKWDSVELYGSRVE